MITIQRTIDKATVNELPVVAFEGEIHLVNTPQQAEHAVNFLKQFPLLGIDTETRPSFSRGQQHKVALLQISAQEHCLLFRLNLTDLTLPVIYLLENPSITKVGLSLHDDFTMLHRRAPFEPRGIVELQEKVKLFGIEELSLQKIYAILFGQKISKSQQLSNWEAKELTLPQQRYAATDAWACLQIYHQLLRLKEEGICISD